jgi:hypothetical protein
VVELGQFGEDGVEVGLGRDVVAWNGVTVEVEAEFAGSESLAAAVLTLFEMGGSGFAVCVCGVWKARSVIWTHCALECLVLEKPMSSDRSCSSS